MWHIKCFTCDVRSSRSAWHGTAWSRKNIFGGIYVMLIRSGGGRSPKCQIARRRWRGEACKLWMQTAISAREKKRKALGETSSHAYQIILPIPPFLRLDFTKFSHRAPWANLRTQSGLCIWSHMRARGADWLECLAWYFLMLGHTHAHKHALA